MLPPEEASHTVNGSCTETDGSQLSESPAAPSSNMMLLSMFLSWRWVARATLMACVLIALTYLRLVVSSPAIAMALWLDVARDEAKLVFVLVALIPAIASGYWLLFHFFRISIDYYEHASLRAVSYDLSVVLGAFVALVPIEIFSHGWATGYMNPFLAAACLAPQVDWAYNSLRSLCQRRASAIIVRPFDSLPSEVSALHLMPLLGCYARPMLLLNSAFEEAFFRSDVRSARMGPVGWTQLRTANEVWKIEFSRMLSRASVAFVDVTSVSDNIRWELAEVAGSIGPRRMIFVSSRGTHPGWLETAKDFPVLLASSQIGTLHSSLTYSKNSILFRAMLPVVFWRATRREQ